MSGSVVDHDSDNDSVSLLNRSVDKWEGTQRGDWRYEDRPYHRDLTVTAARNGAKIEKQLQEDIRSLDEAEKTMNFLNEYVENDGSRTRHMDMPNAVSINAVLKAKKTAQEKGKERMQQQSSQPVFQQELYQQPMHQPISLGVQQPQWQQQQQPSLQQTQQYQQQQYQQQQQQHQYLQQVQQQHQLGQQNDQYLQPQQTQYDTKFLGENTFLTHTPYDEIEETDPQLTDRQDTTNNNSNNNMLQFVKRHNNFRLRKQALQKQSSTLSSPVASPTTKLTAQSSTPVNHALVGTGTGAGAGAGLVVDSLSVLVDTTSGTTSTLSPSHKGGVGGTALPRGGAGVSIVSPQHRTNNSSSSSMTTSALHSPLSALLVGSSSSSSSGGTGHGQGQGSSGQDIPTKTSPLQNKNSPYKGSVVRFTSPSAEEDDDDRESPSTNHDSGYTKTDRDSSSGGRGSGTDHRYDTSQYSDRDRDYANSYALSRDTHDSHTERLLYEAEQRAAALEVILPCSIRDCDISCQYI